MPSVSESEYSENDSCGFNESALNNLKALRLQMVESYASYHQKVIDCELRNYSKYSILSNVKEPFIFQNDELMDLGIQEDLEMLDINSK